MGREKILLRRVLSVLAVHCMLCGSRGLDIAPPPDLPANPPYIHEAASSPVYFMNSHSIAPNPVTSPKESASHSSPILPPTLAVPPIVRTVIPSVQPPIPSDHVGAGHKWPRPISPSMDSQPNGPDGSAHGRSPSYMIPPVAQPRKGRLRDVPTSNSSVTLPHSPVSDPTKKVMHHSPKTPPPIAKISPSVAPTQRTRNFHHEQKSGPAMSPTWITAPVVHGEGYGVPVAAPPKKLSSHISPVYISHPKGAVPASSTVPHYASLVPSPLHPQTPAERMHHSPAFPPVVSNHQHAAGKGVENPAAAPSHYPPTSYCPAEGLVVSPAPVVLPVKRGKHHAPPPRVQSPSVSPIQSPSPSPSPITPEPDEWPSHSSMLSPSGSISGVPTALSPQPIWALPPPPPNFDCISLACPEPLTNPPPGSPCSCVLPIKVGLRLDVALYTFFPMVSEFAQEIASGIYMKQSQVRIIGANAASEQLEKTVVLMHLVPLGEKFDNTTAFLTYEKFWHKQVVITTSLFENYEVLYVTYPGLPPPPPSAPADINLGEGMYGNSNSSRTIKPLGVDVRKRKEKLHGSLIAIIILSSIVVLILCIGAAWHLLLRRSDRMSLPVTIPHTLLPTFAKSSGTGHMLLGRRPSSASASFGSSIAAYSGSAKTFTLAEIERATNRFDASRIIGEGGFGCVYHGILEDGAKVAVKLLKRDDQQGGREFLAEVEMLSRLHHRNLVKLIGICTEEHIRCLVYELIPNGSVESHLHGVDKDTAPLDWNARMKIALGAARGLAYLHEDSSPPVIHRDFKSSNILLDHNFTPKVSDFGLARVALNEGNQHISTRVMGTFGYVAPEYAMTGHLLVKSDVYSYGVVLLELLTGRKPVDMSQPFGQENLVTWARPLLTSMDGLKTIVDSALGTDIPFDTLAKVAAIASMCVQPEVSHRPFIGEVVQALKLVCNESDDNRGSGSCSLEANLAAEMANRTGTGFDIELERVLSASDIFSASAISIRYESDSLQRQSSSGPLRTGSSKQFWQRLRSLSAGSVSEHGFALGRNREGDEQWSS